MLRKVMIAKGVYNIVLGAVFVAFAEQMLPLLGSDHPDSIFLALFASVAAAFGAGFVLAGFDNRAINRPLLTAGFLGQSLVCGVVVWRWLDGRVYNFGLVPALIDLVCALIFLAALRSHSD